VEVTDGAKASAIGTEVEVWALKYVDIAAKDAARFLNEAQYAHAVDLCRQLAAEKNPRCPVSLEVDAIEDFFELKDKGGILGKINLRIYFVVCDGEKSIVVLGCWKKESDGQVPQYIKARMKSRLRFVKGKMSNQKINRKGGGR